MKNKLLVLSLVFAIALALMIGLPAGTMPSAPIPGSDNYLCGLDGDKNILLLIDQPEITKDPQLVIRKITKKITTLKEALKNTPKEKKQKRKKIQNQININVKERAGIIKCYKGEIEIEIDIPVCGNGFIEDGEWCDEAGLPNICCNSDCTPKTAGTACDLSADAELGQCEVSACDGNGACTIQNKDSQCDDKQECTANDRCEGRSCIGDNLTPRIITCGVGECERTINSCSSDAECQPGTPVTEVCNGLDDDCDGETDEELPDIICGQGACKNTVPGCLDGTPQICEPNIAQAEICNGLDDDCDARVDEDLTQSMACGQGACAASGTKSCVDGKFVESCTPKVAQVEVCNSKDDDCDGQIDESISESVSCGVGACTNTATRICVNGIMTGTCSPKQAKIEACNGIDDDCDGQTDDGLAQSISCGIGACFNSGVRDCIGGEFVENCTPKSPGTEVCNRIDDDCDGVNNENIYSCDVDNATARCTNIGCFIQSCDFGYLDLDVNPLNGCEYDLGRCTGGAFGDSRCPRPESFGRDSKCTQSVCQNDKCGFVFSSSSTVCEYQTSTCVVIDGRTYAMKAGSYNCTGWGHCGFSTFECGKNEDCYACLNRAGYYY